MPLPQDHDSQYKLNQSLIKGLSLLAELNRSANASGMISTLARNTGQHRTTVKRLLETLKHAGYVEHDIATNIYRLTYRVLQLSYGYRDTTRVTEVAWPYMREFSKKMVWPCSLVAPEGDEMVVRVSTRPYSKLSFHPGMPGRTMPVLRTAAGRAYIAYASRSARDTLIGMLRSAPESEDALVHDDQLIQTMVEQVRARGYAENFGEWSEEPKFGGYAVPIRNSSDEAMVSLNVIFLTSAVKSTADREKLLEALFEAAHDIEQAYQAVKQQ